MTALMPAPAVEVLPAETQRFGQIRPKLFPAVEEVLLTDDDAQAIHRSRAASTWKGQGDDWRHFTAWCALEGRESLPASVDTVKAYLHAMVRERGYWTRVGPDRRPEWRELPKGYSKGTIGRRLGTIRQRHEDADLPSPTAHPVVKRVWEGLRRTMGDEGRGAPRKVRAATGDVVLRMLATLDVDSVIGARDAALLTIGFCGGFRRSELAGIDIEHVEETADGLSILLPRSKTDQEGLGRTVGIPYVPGPACPVRAWQRWINLAGITSGPAFRSVDRHGNVSARRREDGSLAPLTDKAIALVIKRAAEAAGLDPRLFSGHSLRRGLATDAARGGATEVAIQRVTGHKSVVVLRGYYEEGNRFREHAALYTRLGGG
jgi:integrase